MICQNNRKRVRFLARSGLVAALYIALTELSAILGLSGMSVVQLRLSEALCILPAFTGAAIPGLAVGCLVSNLITGASLPDILFGTLATLLGAVGTWLLKKWPFLAPMPPILANVAIMPLVIAYSYVGQAASLPLLFFTVAAGELLSVGLLGTLLRLALTPHKQYIFPE